MGLANADGIGVRGAAPADEESLNRRHNSLDRAAVVAAVLEDAIASKGLLQAMRVKKMKSKASKVNESSESSRLT